MDHDKLQMTSETEKKEKSSSNENAGKMISGEECAGSNSEENDVTRSLQPFFVADTLEDDESIIPPSQDDSGFLIPSTPAYESEKRSENVDLNESTISILEETCILDNKAQCKDSSREEAATPACNENDMTQDLAELEATQPIIPSNLRIEHSFTTESNNTNENKVVEDEDDEWQLKFSETQTQEALTNYKKNDEIDEEPETQKILPVKDDKPEKEEEEDDDDDLPATLSIEVPPREDDVQGDYFNKVKEPEINEVLETQSDDEIEPSQSCLSEYKGETISSSFKVPSIVETPNEEIPKLCSEKEKENEVSNKSDMDITMIDESEKRTIELSDSEPKNTFNDIKCDSLSVQEMHDENLKKTMGDSISMIDEKRTKDSEFDMESVEKKSVECNIFKETTAKVSDEINPEMIDTNGNQIEEIGLIDDIIDADVENNKIKPSTDIEKMGTETKMLETSATDFISNSEEHNVEIQKGSDNSDKEKSVNSVETLTNKVEHNVEVIDIDEEEKEQTVPKPDEDDQIELIAMLSVSKEIETSKQDSVENIKIQESDVQPHGDVSKTTDSDSFKSTEIVVDSEPTKMSSDAFQTSSEEKTSSKSFAKPSVPLQNVGFLRKQKAQTPSPIPDTSYGRRIASVTDTESLDKIFKSMLMTVDHERLDSFLSKPNEEFEFRAVFRIRNQELFASLYPLESERIRRSNGASPIYSSSTATSSTISSKISSLHSGEMADLSSFSGDAFPKTSTQKSPQKAGGLLQTFGGKDLGETLKSGIDASPVEVLPNTKKKAAPKRKRGGKKNAESSSSDAAHDTKPKNKRAKGKSKPKVKIAEDETDETEESKDAVPDEKPKKPTRRKKEAILDIMPEEIKLAMAMIPTSTEDDSSSFQEDANFGTILPGCKVMARWTDRCYYSGMVQSQEPDGKWSVLFEDKVSHTVSPECLIKIAILPKGTSVMVLSPDDGCFDPGIIRGHFREGNKVGYEVELDNGVTKRYARSAVSLTSDQAKLVMKNAPPTTPTSITINLDNIIDGKRKRKSIQSPVPVTPPVKRSSRVTRSKKPDSNLDSTSDSGVSDDKNKSSIKDSKDEEPPKKKVKKGASSLASVETTSDISEASTSAGTSSTKPTASTSSASTSKTPKVLPGRSAKKLFKDYAFLLTNADRKQVDVSSDSDTSKKEENDIVPFDKEDLYTHINSGGGIILEKFDDHKKCTRKHIYLLANSYLRTMKYIQCIAAGIRCIKHHWVQNCLLMSKILCINSYILPAGYSILSEQVIEWHGKTDVFSNCKIALVSVSESPFVHAWSSVLSTAKADFVQKWNPATSGSSSVVDVLITDKECPSDIIQSAKKRKIPIVSSEWIIQCLIEGKKLPYDAHPKFKYTFFKEQKNA